MMFLIFAALILVAGPREQCKYRAAFLVIFSAAIILLLWSRAPERVEADIRELLG